MVRKGYDYSSYLLSYFYVHYSNNQWNIEKFHERNAEDDYYLRYLFWQNKKTTMLGLDYFIKKDKTSGKIFLEEPPLTYKAIFSVLPPFTWELSFPGTIAYFVDTKGMVHVLVVKGSMFHAQLYYYLYNPNSPTPTIPEISELIEERKG